MAANGAGVVLDASSPAARITWYDSLHADFQDDGLGNSSMDLHKVWSTMGRAGANGVVREGLVEAGDLRNNWPQCYIETVAAGAFGGASVWNTVTAYCVHGAAAAGDYTVYSCLDPFDGLAFHLDTPLAAQPEYAVEYCFNTAPTWFALYARLTTTTNGTTLLQSAALFAGYSAGMAISGPDIPANTTIQSITDASNLVMTNPASGASVAIREIGTLTRKPDFTQANGKSLQRAEWVIPFGGVPSIVLPVSSAPGAYHHVRLRLIAGTGGPTAVGNTNYKDWLYGYFKHFYCYYDLKKGDDTSGTASSPFKHEGLFGIRFRAGFGWTTDTLLGDVQLGGVDKTGKQPRPKWPWYSISTKCPTIHGAKLYGGLMGGRSRYTGESPSPVIRGAVSDGEAISLIMSGWSGSVTFGAAGIAAMKYIDFVRISLGDDIPANLQCVSNYNVSSDAFARDVVIDVPYGKGVSVGLRSSIASATISGIRVTDDDVSSAQVLLSGGGNKNLFDFGFGGPNKKASAPDTKDWRRVDVTIWESESTAHPPAGIPFKIIDAIGQTQVTTGVFDANGTYSQGNSLAGAPGVGEISKNIIAVSQWDGTVEGNLDTYAVMHINYPSMAGYNDEYVSMKVPIRAPRALEYVSGVIAVQDYQATRGHIHVALPKKSVVYPFQSVLFDAATEDVILASVPATT